MGLTRMAGLLGVSERTGSDHNRPDVDAIGGDTIRKQGCDNPFRVSGPEAAFATWKGVNPDRQSSNAFYSSAAVYLLIFNSHSTSLRVSQELTVLIALFFPSFSAHRS